jgi:SAM-dependent methyltransferase
MSQENVSGRLGSWLARRRRARERTQAFEAERRLQLAAGEPTDRERDLLHRVDPQIHANDDMWPLPREHRRAAEMYVWAGLAALRSIEQALRAGGGSDPRTILDLPSGYGRVLRFLRVAYADAEIVACDLNAEGVRFCAQQFGVEPINSRRDVDRVSFAQSFDLIWCGSLLTHLNESDSGALIGLFRRSLTSSGVALVTTHGAHRAPEPDGVWEAGVEPDAVRRLRESVDETGFGWEPYGGTGRYGATVISRDWLRVRAQEHGLRETWFEQDGWGGYQNVCALAPGT